MLGGRKGLPRGGALALRPRCPPQLQARAQGSCLLAPDLVQSPHSYFCLGLSF